MHSLLLFFILFHPKNSRILLLKSNFLWASSSFKEIFYTQDWSHAHGGKSRTSKDFRPSSTKLKICITALCKWVDRVYSTAPPPHTWLGTGIQYTVCTRCQNYIICEMSGNCCLILANFANMSWSGVQKIPAWFSLPILPQIYMYIFIL